MHITYMPISYFKYINMIKKISVMNIEKTLMKMIEWILSYLICLHPCVCFMCPTSSYYKSVKYPTEYIIGCYAMLLTSFMYVNTECCFFRCPLICSTWQVIFVLYSSLIIDLFIVLHYNIFSFYNNNKIRYNKYKYIHT